MKLKSRVELIRLLNTKGLRGYGVELGVASGKFSDRILEISDLKCLYSVDSWSGRIHAKQYNGACKRLSKYGKRSKVIKATFAEAVHQFPDKFFDFIYLDGYAHRAQGGIVTFESWWPKLKIGGIFSGHDYTPRYAKNMRVIDQFAKMVGATLNTTIERRYPSWFYEKKS